MQLVDRVAEVLYCLQAEPGGLGVSEIAARASLAKSTTHRLLQALERCGLVAQDSGSQRYTLGLRLLALASTVLQETGIPLVSSLEPMRRLRDLSGETVCLHLRVGLHRVCVGQVESPHEIRYTMQIGKPFPLYTGASGKLLLAFAPEPVVEQVIETTRLARLTPHTITDRAELLRQLRAIRGDGHAISFGERIPLVAAAAASIREERGQVIACITLYGPRMRLNRRRMEELLPALLATAREISGQVTPTGAARPDSPCP